MIAATPGTLPGTPTLTAAAVGTSVTVTWNSPTNGGSAITGYELQQSTTGTSGWSDAANQPVGANTTVTEAASGTMYYRVRAANIFGSGSYSASASATGVVLPGGVGTITVTPASSSLTVGWSAAANTPTGYLVAYSTDGTTWTSQTLGASATTATLTGLTNGVHYSVQVSATNAAGYGPASIAAGTPRTNSSAPTNLTATLIGSLATLSWVAPTSIGGAQLVGYKVLVSTDAGTTWGVQIANTGNTGITTSFTLTAGAYLFAVEAITQDGNGMLYSPQSTGASLTATPVVSGLASLTATSTNQAIALNWIATTGATAYRIEDSTNGTSWTVVTGSPTTATSFTVSGLTNGTNYFFRVTPQNASGAGAPAIVAATPAGAAGAPILNTPNVAGANIALSWSAPTTNGAPIQGYRIIINGNTSSPTNVYSTALNYNFVGDPNTGSYSFSVAALTGLSTSGLTVGTFSDSQSATISQNAITNLIPVGVASIVPQRRTSTAQPLALTLTWNTAPAGLMDYFIQVEPFSALNTGADKWQPVHLVSGTTVVGKFDIDTATAMVGTVLPAPALNVLIDGLCANTVTGFVQGADCTGYTPFVASQQYVFQVSAYVGTGLTSLKAKSLASTTTNKAKSVVADASTNGVAGSFTFAQIEDVPSAISGISTSPVGPGQIAVHWSAPNDGGSPITAYTVIVDDHAASGTDTYETLTATTQPALIFSAQGALTDQYSFQLFASNVIGDGPLSAWSAFTQAVPRPSVLAGGVSATLGAISSGSTPITLSWTPTGDTSTVQNWSVEYSIDGINWTSSLQSISTTTYTFTGLTAGTPYYFRVAAVNQAGYGDYNLTSAIPLGTPDAPVVDTPITSDTTALLHWTPPLHMAGRTILSYTVQDGSGSAISSCAVGLTTSCTVTGLTIGQSYTYQVAATYFDVLSNSNETVTSTTVTASPMNPPSAPIAGSSSVSSGSATITWSAGSTSNAPAATAYRIQVITGTNATPVDTATVAASQTSYTFNNLVNGQLYIWRIYALDATTPSTGYAEFSSVPVGLPHPPTGLVVTPSKNQVQIGWTTPTWENSGGSAVDLYQVNVTQGGVTTDETNCDTANFCTVTGLVNDETVTVSIKSHNAQGFSLTSVSTIVTPTDTTLPVTAVTYTSPDSGKVTLTWAAPSPAATAYIIEQSTDGHTWSTLATQAGTSITITGVINDSAYDFRITPEFGNATGPGYVLVASATGPASVVRNLNAIATDGKVQLTWTSPVSSGGQNALQSGSNPILGYQITLLGAGGSTVFDWSGSSNGIIWPNLVNGTTYTFVVSAITKRVTSSINTLNPPSAAVTSASVDYFVGATSQIQATPVPLPTGVTNLSVLDNGNGSFTLNWSADPSATSYTVEYAASSQSPLVVASACANLPETTTTCTLSISNFVVGSTPIFEVVSNNAAGSTQKYTLNGTSSNTSTTLPVTLPAVASISYVLGTDLNSGTVTLSWPTLSGADTYTVSVALHGTGNFFPSMCNTSATTCVLTGLIPATTYDFQVLPYGLGGIGLLDTVTATTSTYTLPTNGGGGGFAFAAPLVITPLPLGATSLKAVGGDRQVTLSWVAASDSNRTNFKVEYSLDGSTWTAGTSVSASATTATIGSLKNGVATIFRLTPVGPGGNGLPATANATPGIAATAPQNLSAAPGDSVVDLKWSAPTDNGGLPITSYVVEQSTDGTTWSQVAAVDGSTYTANIVGLTNFTSYNFRVSAMTSFGKGQSATLSSQPSALPTAPLSLSIVSVSNGAVVVGWKAPTGSDANAITGYKVERSGDGTTWTTATTTTASATSAAITGLTNGTTYQFRVTPVTSNGAGASSVILGTPATLPGTVQGLTASSADKKVTLIFNQPADTGGYGIDHYMVEIASAESGPWKQVIANSGSSLTRIDVPGLTDGTVYFFRVTALTTVGSGPASAPISAAPQTVASAPALQTFAINNNSVTLSWSAPTNTGGKPVTKYLVEVSADGNSWVISSTSAPGVKSASVPLTKSAQLIRIVAVTTFGNGVPSLGVRAPGDPASKLTAPTGTPVPAITAPTPAASANSGATTPGVTAPAPTASAKPTTKTATKKAVTKKKAVKKK